MNDKRRQYPGPASDGEGQQGAVKGRALTKTATNKQKAAEWQDHIVKIVKGQIEKGDLKTIPPDKECNLYITLYLRDDTFLPDIDNSLKVFIDPLMKTYGRNKPGAGLITDDRCIRGIKANREIIPAGATERVMFWYLVTHTFYIEDVERVPINVAQEEYSDSWRNEMQLIRARADGEKGERYAFIDNKPECVYSGIKTEGKKGKQLDVIPGYDWSSVEGKIVNGCLVFNRKPSAPAKNGEHERIWWINKWYV